MVDTFFKPNESEEFNHYALKYQNGTTNFYCNGRMIFVEKDLDLGGGAFDTTGALHFGIDPTSMTDGLKGRINYFCAFKDKLISDAALKTLAKNGMTPLPRAARNALGRFTGDGRTCIAACTTDPTPNSTTDAPAGAKDTPTVLSQTQGLTPQEIQDATPNETGANTGSDDTTCAITANTED